jgi:hypothetical protein
MPYEKVELEEYLELLKRMPASIDWSALRELEPVGGEDKCVYQLACSAAGGCEMVDVL